MATITFGGLASGLDTNAIIDGLMAAEKVPLTRLQTAQAQADSAATTLSGIASKLSTLRAAAAALADPIQFASFAASSSDAAVVPSVYTATMPGSYSVQVGKLALEQRTFADAQSSSSSALNLSGTLQMTINGTTSTVNVSSTDSLADIAANINGSGARASASVLYDGTNYRLQVRGLDTGAANAISFSESGFSLGLSNAQNTYQQAQDAQLTVEGISVTRPTNSVSGVIPGVTLALTKTTQSPVSVTVSSDPSALKTKVQKFVDAYNDVVNTSHSAVGYGSQLAPNPKLSGDSAVRSALLQLSSVAGSVVSGTSGKYTMLASIGLSSTRDGTLTLDSTKLAAALADDPTAVARVFVTDPSIKATGVMATVKTTIDGLTGTPTALLDARVEGMQKQSKRMQDEQAAMQRNLDAFQQRLRDQFTNLETVVSKYKSLGSALNNFSGVGIYGGSNNSG